MERDPPARCPQTAAASPGPPGVPGPPEVCLACAGFGAAYGAVCGAIAGGLVGHLIVDACGETVTAERTVVATFSALGAAWPGAGLGATLGILGGGAAGIIGTALRRRWAWGVAGLLGTVAVEAALAAFLGAGAGARGRLLAHPVCLLLDLIAGLLGVALARALRTGRSFVPGVGALAAVINEASPPRRAAERPGTPAEVSPASAPQGRGDEATPVVKVWQ